MDQEMLRGLMLFAAIGAAILWQARYSTEGRLERLRSKHVEANALNLLAVAHREAEATGDCSGYDCVRADMLEVSSFAVNRWDRLRPDQRKALVQIAIHFVGREGAHQYYERVNERCRRSMGDMQEEIRAWSHSTTPERSD